MRRGFSSRQFHAGGGYVGLSSESLQDKLPTLAWKALNDRH